MARRFVHTRGRRGTSRETLWLAGDVSGVTLAAASTASLLFSYNAGALALRPFTIVRTRGVLLVRSDQAAVSEDYQVAMGMSVVSDQANAIGVTAVPTPATDSGSDMFFVYEQVLGHFQFLDSTGFHPAAATVLQFDSKAMRRVNDDQDLAVTLETAAASSGAVAQMMFRQLVKLH